MNYINQLLQYNPHILDGTKQYALFEELTFNATGATVDFSYN